MQGPNIKENVSLAPYTTLGVGGNASYYVEVTTLEELREATKWAKRNNTRIVILGGGSNVLFPDEGLEVLVMHMGISKQIYETQDDEVFVTVGAGVILDEFISELVDRKIWGLENLSAVPGTVGATPIQNVGAYGVEVSDIITSVVVYSVDEDVFITLSNTECHFDYRDSLFKQKKDDYIIVWVTFKLSMLPQPKLSYKDLERYFKDNDSPTLEEIRKAVTVIRSKKFPDWRCIGTAGSFFKNPIIQASEFTKLRAKYPTLPGFIMKDGQVKIPLGYVLDKLLDLKGHWEGNVGLYKEQALVLVARESATAKEIIAFALSVQKKVKQTTDLDVAFEVTQCM